MTAIEWDIFVGDGAKGVSAFHALASAVRASYPLAEATELCAVGGGPGRAKLGVMA